MTDKPWICGNKNIQRFNHPEVSDAEALVAACLVIFSFIFLFDLYLGFPLSERRAAELSVQIKIVPVV